MSSWLGRLNKNSFFYDEWHWAPNKSQNEWTCPISAGLETLSNWDGFAIVYTLAHLGHVLTSDRPRQSSSDHSILCMYLYATVRWLRWPRSCRYSQFSSIYSHLHWSYSSYDDYLDDESYSVYRCWKNSLYTIHAFLTSFLFIYHDQVLSTGSWFRLADPLHLHVRSPSHARVYKVCPSLHVTVMSILYDDLLYKHEWQAYVLAVTLTSQDEIFMPWLNVPPEWRICISYFEK